MSIELQNPETVLGKVDAAANCVAQIRIALMVGSTEHAMNSLAEAERLLFTAIEQIEQEEASK